MKSCHVNTSLGLVGGCIPPVSAPGRTMILRTLHTGPKMIKAVKSGISSTDLNDALLRLRQKTVATQKVLSNKSHAITPNKTQPHVLIDAERHAAALIDR